MAINGIYLKNGHYITTGGLYQSTLSDQNFVDIKQVIKLTGLRYVSISTRLRHTCCFSNKKELEEISNVKLKKEIIKTKINKKNKNSQNIEFNELHSTLPELNSLPLICPLGIYIIENYPFFQNKENCIIALKFKDKMIEVNGEQVSENIYAAVTIYNDSIFSTDGKGEFIGNEEELIRYIRDIKDKISITAIHSTSECYQIIEDTFFNENFKFKKIGVDAKNKKEFNPQYNSESLFWNKKWLTNGDKLAFYDFNEKDEKLKKRLIISGVVIAVLGVLSGVGYYFYNDYQQEQIRLKLEAEEKLKKKIIPQMPFNTIAYFNKYCFKDIDKFLVPNNKNWAINSLTCSSKGVNYTISELVDQGNFLTNKNSFFVTYNIESDLARKLKFDQSGRKVIYGLSEKFNGVLQNKVIKFPENEMRAYISDLTQSQDDRNYAIKVGADLKTGYAKDWTITSNLSPVFLQNNYGIFNKLYISNISMTVDSDGIYNWTVKGAF